MIVKNGHWVIVTPTKCGTYTVEALTEKVGAWHTDPRHTPDVPLQFSDLPCYMMRRDPYERWVSMYWFMRHLRERGASGWHNKYTHSVEEWAERFFWAEDNVPYWMWTCDLTWYYETCRPVETFDVDQDLEKLREVLQISARIPHRNHKRTEPEQSVQETLSKLNGRLLKRVHVWCERDCNMFGYSHR